MLLTTVLGSALAGIDATVVGIALPQIGQDLDVSIGRAPAVRAGGIAHRGDGALSGAVTLSSLVPAKCGKTHLHDSRIAA